GRPGTRKGAFTCTGIHALTPKRVKAALAAPPRTSQCSQRPLTQCSRRFLGDCDGGPRRDGQGVSRADFTARALDGNDLVSPLCRTTVRAGPDSRGGAG